MKPQNQDKESDIPSEVLERALHDSSRKAIDESFALGIPIMVEEEGKLIRIYPDGKKVEVKEEELSGS